MPSRQSQHQYTLANGIERPALSLASAMPPQSYGTRMITRLGSLESTRRLIDASRAEFQRKPVLHYSGTPNSGNGMQRWVWLMISLLKVFALWRLRLITQAVVRESTRDQLDVKITLGYDTAEKLVKDPSIKALIYCASDPIPPYSKSEISFPYQIEIKVNQDEVKANLRGLKNKPGSTRPADITSLLRRRAGYENSLTVIYALTTKVSYP